MDNLRLEPGTVLAEKYRLESVLGTGGMGTVYRAEHLALKAPVAIKVIDREVSEGDVALARFMREAQAAASLRSPHVVQILDYGTEGARPFMVMEMLEGESLADRIDRVGRLTPEETYRVISHVAKAIAKAHEADIIHRDLKPDNVFLVHNEGDEIAKVLDFGVAKVEATQLDGSGHTRTGSLLGTPYYMSPEQAQGNKDIDARSDLWALGVIAFECLVGRRPFSSDGLGDLVLQICIRDIPRPSDDVSVPDGFDDWFFRACEREPADRFQTARELAEGLRPALGLGDGGSIPESRWSRVAPVIAPAAAAGVSSESGLTQDEAAALSERTTESDPSRRGGAAQDVAKRDTLLEGSLPGDDTTPDQQEPAPRSSNTPERALAPEASAEQDAAPVSVGARTSQWEIVPHQEVRSSAFEASVSDIPKKGASGSSILFVAVTALLLGGGAVFGLKQAGVDLLGEDNVSQPRLTTPPKKPQLVKQSADVSEEGDAQQPKKKRRKKASGQNTGAEEEGDSETEEEESDSTGEGETLDEIDAAAAEALDALEAEGEQTDPDAPAEPDQTGEQGDATKTDQPLSLIHI